MLCFCPTFFYMSIINKFLLFYIFPNQKDSADRDFRTIPLLVLRRVPEQG